MPYTTRKRIEELAPAVEAFYDVAVPIIMAALLAFAEDPDYVLCRLLVEIARATKVTGSHQYVKQGVYVQFVVLKLITACLQFGSCDVDDASKFFNEACEKVRSDLAAGTHLPSVTPSPAPQNPYPEFQDTESLDEIVERKVKKALSSSANVNSSTGSRAQSEAFEHIIAANREIDASHGPGTCSHVPADVSKTLQEAGFVPYRWARASDDRFDIRRALYDMCEFLKDEGHFLKFAGKKDTKLAGAEFSLYFTGSLQARCELVAATMFGRKDLINVLIAARLDGVDTTSLPKYVSGQYPVPGNPLFGGSKTFTARGNGGASGGDGGESNEKKKRDAKTKAEKADKALKLATEAAAKAAKDLKEVSN